MNWMIYAMATALALALADFFVKMAAGKLSNSLALFIYGSCTFAAGLIWVLLQRFQGTPQFAHPKGVLSAVGVGLAFTLVTLGLYATFGAGAPISLGSPAIRLSGLMLASLLGILVLGEPISWRYIFGVILACGGIYLIVTR